MRFPFVLIPHKTNFNFTGQKKLAFGFSIFLVLATLVFLISRGLNLGTDFTGGVVIELKTNQVADVAKFRELFSSLGYQGTIIQNITDEYNILIRFQTKASENQSKEVEGVKEALIAHIQGGIEFRKIDYVGPKVGQELILKGVQSVVIALLGMMIYIWFRFNWQFGICAVVALLHDAIATVGFYLVSRVEFDLTSIAAILMIVGYSINDKVVISDRIRENLRKYKIKDLSEIINVSLNETLSRTIMTVATTLLATLALIVFGGEVIRGFSLAMFIGIMIGTYSSVYISAPLLVYTYKKVE